MRRRSISRYFAEGCVSAVYACTVASETGQYICPPAQVEPGSPLANDEALGEQMMKLTRQLVQDKTGITIDLY
jgi:hypothetical protein